LLSVLPGIGAFATFSPPLDNEGNCVRGVALIDKMSAVYGNINIFHKDGIKLDVTRRPYQTLIQTVIASCKAAATGDLETLNRLQASGVNLGDSDYDQRSPLHLAAASNNFAVVKFLVECKAHVNSEDRWKSTPLNETNDHQIINFLESMGARRTGTSPVAVLNTKGLLVTEQFRLFYSAKENDVRTMQSLLIMKSVLLNGVDYDGRSALNIAASEGNLNAVKYLVYQNADITLKDLRGNDALADAQREGRKDVVAFLQAMLPVAQPQQ